MTSRSAPEDMTRPQPFVTNLRPTRKTACCFLQYCYIVSVFHSKEQLSVFLLLLVTIMMATGDVGKEYSLATAVSRFTSDVLFALIHLRKSRCASVSVWPYASCYRKLAISNELLFSSRSVNSGCTNANDKWSYVKAEWLPVPPFVRYASFLRHNFTFQTNKLCHQQELLKAQNEKKEKTNTTSVKLRSGFPCHSTLSGALFVSKQQYSPTFSPQACSIFYFFLHLAIITVCHLSGSGECVQEGCTRVLFPAHMCCIGVA